MIHRRNPMHRRMGTKGRMGAKRQERNEKMTIKMAMVSRIDKMKTIVLYFFW